MYSPKADMKVADFNWIGQPFKAPRAQLGRQALVDCLLDTHDPVVSAFGGNAQELLAEVQRVTGDYAEHCPLCEAPDQDDFD